MADYIYLLQNRLSAPQQAALQSIRDVAKAHGLTVFLVGGAVRDLTSGSPVRDLDVVIQGNALKLKKDMELAGAVLAGEMPAAQAFFARFSGGVRVEIGSTLSVSYPKPGKPMVQPATILDDLRRRDFTANAMALSLNDGSYGLLMDPLNGVADIENRQLRLVSNYGFIEDPVRMIRAARFSARLGWAMDEKTQARYETGKSEKYIGALSAVLRGYETEEIFHEEDPLRVLRKLEEEGWTKHLFPALTVAKANVAEIEKLREVQTQLQVAGINPDAAPANFPLLTAKLSATEVAELKKSFVRQGFVREIETLEADAKEFVTQLSGKSAALPSQAWKLIHAAKPEAVLWVAYSSKGPAIQAKFKSFHTEWPKARQKVPFALMQEMRIVPELDTFNEVVDKIFFELMDGNLTTPEEQKAFLEPFSPPAPPPPVRLSRSRANKKDAKGAKGKKKMAALVEDDEDADLDLDADLDDEAPLPDDEDEGSEPVLPAVEDDAEETIEAAEPEAPASPEPEVEPIPEPVPAALKPKRTKPASSPARQVQQVPLEADVVLAPPAKPTATSSKKREPAASGQKDVEEVLPRKDLKPAMASLTGKIPQPPAKVMQTPVPSGKEAKPVKTAAHTVKQTSVEQVATPAVKAVPAKAIPAVKPSAGKEAAIPAKVPAKKR